MSEQGPPPPAERPPYGGRDYGPKADGGSPQSYPQQELSHQDVQPGRSRKPLIISLVVVLVLIGGGVGAWLLLRDNGEDTRAAYCGALKDLTHDGDLMVALSAPSEDVADQLATLVELAPEVVADDYQKLQDLQSSGTFENFDLTAILQVVAAFRAISDDAGSKCDISIEVPNL